jgi:shikimate 5-dehydrogenase
VLPNGGNKVAIIGAGGVAKALLRHTKIDKFDLFTSTGEGYLAL